MDIPDGYALVPLEPTVGMFLALQPWLKPQSNGAHSLFAAQWALGSFPEDYRSMLAAAPRPKVV